MASNIDERELCRYFLNGTCRYGQNCYYSHEYSHDRSSKRSTVCQYYLMGNCAYGDSCFNDHVKPKPPSTSSSSSSSSSPSSSANNETNEMPDSNSKLVRRILNKPKLITCLKGEHNDLNDLSEVKNNPSSYSEALTGTQNCNLDLDNLNNYDENHVDLKTLELNYEKLLCPIYEKSLSCPYESCCEYVHGNICDICNTACLNPYDEAQCEQHKIECMQIMEKEMEEAFAIQRSSQKICGICMEIIWEKEKETDRRFGILENCNHTFCLECIRKWRATKTYENKIVKACPECRVKSDFVTPNRFWFENEENKKNIIQDYKLKLGKTSCKYFKEGEGHCPFGNKCFYLHQYKDGRIAVLDEPRRKTRFNREGQRESYSSIVVIDFDFSDSEEDDFYFEEFFRNNFLWDNDSDNSDLFDEF